MDGMHPKAGLFSAVLTAFIIDRSQSIQPTPAAQSAFYQQQSVALLNQISQQLSSLGAQIPVPSNSSLPDFILSPSTSDVRVNIIWIISLVSSLTAALLATLIRQWARDHMRIFQYYRHPLKVARLRQYLYEGSSRRGYMRAIAEAVPGLVHISLFLFLAGLADFLLNTYTTVGTSTLFATVLCAMLYIIITVTPSVNPQSSYRTPFSPLVWYITRNLWRKSSAGGFRFTPLRLGFDIAEGQMRIAMRFGVARHLRDARAIGWLVNSLTFNVEDAGSLALAIIGTFDTRWCANAWVRERIDRNKELYRDIRRLFETCSNRRLFKDEDEWRVRARACTEAMALFVFSMGADISLIRHPGKVLSDIASSGGTREVSEIKSNQSFAIRWTCLSLVIIRKLLNSSELQSYAHTTLQQLSAFHPEDGLDPTETALRTARSIDEQFAAAWNHVERLRQALNTSEEKDLTRGRITKILRQNEPDLTPIQEQVESMERLGMDASLSELQQRINEETHGLIQKLPGVAFDDVTGTTTVGQTLDLVAGPVQPQLIYLSRLLRRLFGINQEWRNQGLQEMVRTLRSIEAIPSSLSQSHLMERQLWRLQDLSNGAFGFTLELYFLSIRQLLSTLPSPPSEIHETVFDRALWDITSDWQEFNSIGTRQIILDLVCDIAFRDRGIFSNVGYPGYITMTLLDLLRRMIAGQGGAFVEDAKREIRREDLTVFDPQFLSKARDILGQPHE